MGWHSDDQCVEYITDGSGRQISARVVPCGEPKDITVKTDYQIYVEACREMGVEPQSMARWSGQVENSTREAIVFTNENIFRAIAVVSGLMILNFLFVNKHIPEAHGYFVYILPWAGLISAFVGSAFCATTKEYKESPPCFMWPGIIALVWFLLLRWNVTPEKDALRVEIESQMQNSSCLYDDFVSWRREGKPGVVAEIQFFDHRANGYHDLGVYRYTNWEKTRPDREVDPLAAYYVKDGDENITVVTELVDHFCK